MTEDYFERIKKSAHYYDPKFKDVVQVVEVTRVCGLTAISKTGDRISYCPASIARLQEVFYVSTDGTVYLTVLKPRYDTPIANHAFYPRIEFLENYAKG